MLRVILGVTLALSLMLAPSSWAAEEGTVVGSTVADPSGKGSINVPINASLNAKDVAEDIRTNVELTNEAKPALVEPDSVVEGSVRIDFADAVPGSTVEAILPEEAARRALAAAVAGGGLSTGAIVGATAVLVTGGTLGGLAASGQFKSTQRPASGSK